MFSATAGVVCRHRQVAAVCLCVWQYKTEHAGCLRSTLALHVFVYLRSGRCWRDTVKNVGDSMQFVFVTPALLLALERGGRTGECANGVSCYTHSTSPSLLSPCDLSTSLPPLARVPVSRNVAPSLLFSCIICLYHCTFRIRGTLKGAVPGLQSSKSPKTEIKKM
jgi:hypothetical protein